MVMTNEKFHFRHSLFITVFLCYSFISHAQTVPPVYKEVYDELEPKLQQIMTVIDQRWDGQIHPTRFSSDLQMCNTQIQKTKLLTPGVYALTVQMLDALVEMGMTTVRFNFSYPFLVSTFPDSDQYLDLFQRIVQAARDRHFTVFIKCASTNTNPQYGSLDPIVANFMSGLTPARYKMEKREMIEAIIQNLQPSFLTIEEEPETMEAATGLDYSPDSLVGYIEYFLDGLDKQGSLIGAGQGSWESMTYIDRLVEIPGLDYLDIHVYPVNVDFIDDNLFTIYEKTTSHSKSLIFGECWLHKTSDQDLAAQLSPAERFKRDLFSFWYPLDSLYTRMLANFAHYSKAEIVTLYWSVLFFGNLDYQPGYESLSSDSLTSLTVPQSLQNMNNGILTPIGRFYKEIISEANTATPVDPLSNPMTAPGYFDLLENYPDPFNIQTTIPFTLPSSEHITLKIVDTLGRTVRTLLSEKKPPGRYNILWNGRDDIGRIVTSGLYFYRLQSAKGRTLTNKCLLLK